MAPVFPSWRVFIQQDCNLLQSLKVFKQSFNGVVFFVNGRKWNESHWFLLICFTRMNTLGCSRVHDSFHFYIFLGMTFRIIFVWLTIHFKERNTVKPRETLRFTIITEAANLISKRAQTPKLLIVIVTSFSQNNQKRVTKQPPTKSTGNKISSPREGGGWGNQVSPQIL